MLLLDAKPESLDYSCKGSEPQMFWYWCLTHCLLGNFSCFLAHLSRRHPSVRRRPFSFSNIFSSETTWPIKAKFYVEPPWEGGTKVCINGPGHMTKMAAMPIYMAKTLKNLLLQNQKSYDFETWHVASGTQALHSLYK